MFTNFIARAYQSGTEVMTGFDRDRRIETFAATDLEITNTAQAPAPQSRAATRAPLRWSWGRPDHRPCGILVRLQRHQGLRGPQRRHAEPAALATHKLFLAGILLAGLEESHLILGSSSV